MVSALTPPVWDNEVARCRYVDDICWVSHVYCHKCLSVAVELMYSVPFDIEPESSIVTWLDLCMDVPTLTWSMKPKAWVMPPPWGCERHFAYGLLSGRIQRWGEVGLSDSAWLRVTIPVMIGFREAGWSVHTVRAAVFKCNSKMSRNRFAMLRQVLKRVWH